MLEGQSRRRRINTPSPIGIKPNYKKSHRSETEINTMPISYDQINQENKELKIKIKKLEEQNELQLKKFRSIIQKLKKENESYSDDLIKKNQEIKLLHKRCESTTECNSETQGFIRQQQLSKYQDQLRLEAIRISELTQDLENSKKENDELTRKCLFFSTANTKLQKEINQYKSNIDTLEKEKETLSAQLENSMQAYQEYFESSSLEQHRLVDSEKEKEKEIAQCRQNISKLKDQLSHANQIISEQKEALQ